MTTTTPKLPRCERKKIRIAEFVRQQATAKAEKAEFIRLHPVSSGAVRLEDYVPPTGYGKRA